MKEKEFSISYKILSENELSEEQKKTMEAATNAVKTAYSPYSNYQVGAALFLENGEVVAGNNQENAVYPLGLCAERVALFNSGTLYPTVKPLLLALTVASENKPGFPCGSCRQALIEFELRFECEISILIESRNNEYIYFDSVKEILPFAFDQSNLG
ncbi:MAG: cytidine deaminase [Bacteroidota bacterium]